MGAEEAVHKAVHDALAEPQTILYGLIATRVFDRVPNPPPGYPYVSLEIDVADDGNGCSDASSAHVTVHVWSNAVGSLEAKRIGALIRARLAPADPAEQFAIPGFATGASNFDAAVYRAGADPALTEGVLTFTYLIDPTE